MPSRSSVLHSTEPECAPKTVAHPTIRPSDNFVLIYLRVSPNIMKPSTIFKDISHLKLEAISIFLIIFKCISFLKVKTS